MMNILVIKTAVVWNPSGQNRQINSLKERVFVNSAVNSLYSTYSVKNTLLQILPTGS